MSTLATSLFVIWLIGFIICVNAEIVAEFANAIASEIKNEKTAILSEPFIALLITVFWFISVPVAVGLMWFTIYKLAQDEEYMENDRVG